MQPENDSHNARCSDCSPYFLHALYLVLKIHVLHVVSKRNPLQALTNKAQQSQTCNKPPGSTRKYMERILSSHNEMTII